MNLYVFFEEVNWQNQILFNMIRNSHPNAIGIVLNDEHILSEHMVSLMEIVLERVHNKTISCSEEKNLYVSFVNIPKFWSIHSEMKNTATISSKGKVRGRIYYAFPNEKHYVEKVEWFDESGKLLRSDFYNKYGSIFVSAYKNVNGQLIHKIYYDCHGNQIMVHDDSTDSYFVMNDGYMNLCYSNKEELYKTLFHEIISDQDSLLFASYNLYRLMEEKSLIDMETCNLLLFSEKDIAEFVGETREQNIKWALVDDSISKQKKGQLLEAKSYVYQPMRKSEKKNFTQDILILTHSDQIKNLSILVEALPDMRFHIAARTAVSEYLRSFGKYRNVTIYPGVNDDTLYELLQKCSILLDISFGMEFPRALFFATYYGLLMVGYEETVHNDTYIQKNCLFTDSSTDEMIEFIKQMKCNFDIYDEYIQTQDAYLQSNNVTFVEER